MKTLFALLLSTSLLFSENEEITLAEVPIFTSPSLPELQGTKLAPLLPKAHKSSFGAVSLAFLVPGLGHVYLGDLITASELFGTATISRSLSRYHKTDPYTILASYGTTSMYNIYAAYRDVRINNNQTGYKYRMPMDSFTDLAAASFQWRILSKPEVWGGFIGALTTGMLLDRFVLRPKAPTENLVSASTFKSISPLRAFSVGIGEEAYFRGFIQSFCAERMDPAYAIACSSIIFGVAHVGNIIGYDENGIVSFASNSKEYLTYGIPFITAFGGYFGWLSHKNRSLKEGVALHAWYDFAIFLENAITHTAIPMATGGDPQFAFSFAF